MSFNLTLSLLAITLVFIFTSASPITVRQVPDFVFDGDAPFSVDPATLAAAVTCPNGNPTSDSPPVFLVHGTATTGEESWGEGYVPALLANGYTACYVTLRNHSPPTLPEPPSILTSTPAGRAMGDMQISSEYIAYGLHYTSFLSGGLPTAVISHSQGGPDTQWALQFWPSTHSITRAFIALSPDFNGINFLSSNLSSFCVGDSCQASLWQQSAGSQYYDALHRENFDAQVPTTAIWTQFDGVVTPAEYNADLPSATAVSVQQLCPGRLTNHVFMTIDAAAFSLALDALDHDGAASVGRVMPRALSICLRLNAKHMQLSVAEQVQAAFNDAVNGFLLGGPRVSAEPPIMAYAE